MFLLKLTKFDLITINPKHKNHDVFAQTYQI